MKISKILFYISFAPAAFLLMWALSSMLGGFSFWGSTSYGFEAFIDVIMLGGWVLCYVPVLPACFIYQMLYLLMFRNDREHTDIAEARFKLSERTKSIIAVSVFVIFALSILGRLFGSRIDRAIERHQAQKMYAAAEIKVDYDPNDKYNNEQFPSGVLGIDEQKNRCLLIDYDKMRIGIIIDEWPSGHENYIEYELTKSEPDSKEVKSIKEKYYIQTAVAFSNGDRFVSFCYSPDSSHQTSAVLLECSDGSVYYIDETKDEDGAWLYTGLGGHLGYEGSHVKYDELNSKEILVI